MLLALFVQNTNKAQGYVVCCVRMVCNKLYLLALLSHHGLCGAVQEICIFAVTLASWVCESLCTNWGKHSEGCSEISLALRLWFCYQKLNRASIAVQVRLSEVGLEHAQRSRQSPWFMPGARGDDGACCGLRAPLPAVQHSMQTKSAD